MPFQWLTMRVQEEKDRRGKEVWIRERLPRTLAELYESLKECVDPYREAFGAQSAEIALEDNRIRATLREERGPSWQPRAEVLVDAVAGLPGFRIDYGGEATELQIGVLPGDRVFYKHGDQFLTMEQVTKLILDRALFPKLTEG